MHLHLIHCWIKHISRWSTQLINIRQHKNGYNSICFTDVELKFDVVLDESFPTHPPRETFQNIG